VVPAPYHEFFSGCADVAGALVGLLFVAISISPEKVTGTGATTAFELRAAAAFSALVNALVVTLFALLPKTNLGTPALIAAVGGLGSTAGIALIQFRESTTRRPLDFLLVLALVPVYGFQLVSAIELLQHPAATGALQTEAILVVVCFLIGIARAWELLGARHTGIVHTAIALTRTQASAVIPGEAPDGSPGTDEPGPG
jgi:hypothetical protein